MALSVASVCPPQCWAGEGDGGVSGGRGTIFGLLKRGLDLADCRHSQSSAWKKPWRISELEVTGGGWSTHILEVEIPRFKNTQYSITRTKSWSQDGLRSKCTSIYENQVVKMSMYCVAETSNIVSMLTSLPQAVLSNIVCTSRGDSLVAPFRSKSNDFTTLSDN